MNAISLGIIGCGRATQQLHLPALRAVPDMNVMALADIAPEQLQKAGKTSSAQHLYESGEKLIGDSSVEAIAVCTPPDAHANLVVQALGAGKHVFVEKPLALSLPDAEEMVRAERAAEKVAAIGFNLRFHRFIQRARSLIASGQLGDIIQIVTAWSAPTATNFGGGVLFDLGVHHIDACSFLLANSIKDARVLARVGPSDGESVSLLARSSSGTLISSSFSYSPAAFNEFRIVGTRRSVSFSLTDATNFNVFDPSRPQQGLRAHLSRLRSLGDFPSLVRAVGSGGDYMLSYREEWKAFAAAVRGEARAVPTLADGLAAQKVIHAAIANAN